MIDTTRIEAKRPVRVGDHVEYLGDFGAAYAGLIVDVAANGEMIVARRGAKETAFDPRTLRVATAHQ